MPHPKRGPGRPPTPGGPRQIVNLRLAAGVLAALDAAVTRTGETRSGYVRRAVHEALLRDEARAMVLAR